MKQMQPFKYHLYTKAELKKLVDRIINSALTQDFLNSIEEITKIANSIRYAEKLPPDFGVVLMKDYMYIEKDYKRKLMAIPDFAKWLSAKGKILNGDIK